jgi:hypothetical protein
MIGRRISALPRPHCAPDLGTHQKRFQIGAVGPYDRSRQHDRLFSPAIHDVATSDRTVRKIVVIAA